MGCGTFRTEPADNGASNGANSNQAAIVRYASAVLSGSALLPTVARKERQDRDAEGERGKADTSKGTAVVPE